MKKNEPVSMDMPEVKDIPGQENIKPPRLSEMADTTIASDSDEGKGILDDINNDPGNDSTLDNDSNVSEEEKELLSHSDRPLSEERTDRDKLLLDQTDGDDPLNEKANPGDMGEDLDTPGTDLDDENESIGEEDEENNNYSLPD